MHITYTDIKPKDICIHPSGNILTKRLKCVLKMKWDIFNVGKIISINNSLAIKYQHAQYLDKSWGWP